jgi:membrane protein EpsK
MATEIAYILVATFNGLLMVPYFKDELGLIAYAIIPLATSVTGYVTIMSDSFSESVNRFFIISLRKGDRDDSLLTYNTSIRAMLKLCVIIMPVMALVAYLSPYIFNIGDSSRLDVQLMFLLTLWSSMVFALGTCYNNTFVAENKMVVINVMRITYLLSQIVLIFLLFILGSPSLVYIGLTYMMSSWLYTSVSFLLMRRNYVFLRFKRNMNDAQRLKSIGNLGIWAIMNKLGGMFFLEASLIITNLYLGVEAEGHFSFVVTMVSMVGTTCMMFSNVFSPHYYDSYASEDMGRMANIARVGVSFTGMILAMPLAFVCVFSPQILTAWVGPSEAFLSDIIWVAFSILILHYSLYVLNPISTVTLKARPAALQVIFCGFINIGLALLVVTYTDWGLMGVTMSWVVSMLIRSILAFPILNARILNTSLRNITVPQWRSAALFAVCLVVLWGISKIFTMPSSLVIIAVSFLLLFAIYIVVAMNIVFTKSEKQELLKFMPQSVSRIFHMLLR